MDMYGGQMCAVLMFTPYQYLKFLTAGNLKVLVYSAPIEYYELFHKLLFIAALDLAASLATLNVYDIP
jgi:hypothetical protein